MQQRYYDPVAGRFMSVDPVLTDANTGASFNRYVYTNNNPYSKIDRDGRDPEHAYLPSGMSKEEYTATNLIVAEKTIDIGLRFAQMVPQLRGPATVLRAANSSTSSAARVSTKEIPKPPTGKGSVPPGDRDPKRTLSKDERAKELQKADGKCEKCSKDITVEEARAHHIERHADGGKTTPENTAIVCVDCHKEIHAPPPK